MEIESDRPPTGDHARSGPYVPPVINLDIVELIDPELLKPSLAPTFETAASHRKRSHVEIEDNTDDDDALPTPAEQCRKTSAEVQQHNVTAKRQRPSTATSFDNMNTTMQAVLKKMDTLDAKDDTIAKSTVIEAQKNIRQEPKLTKKGKAVMMEVLSSKIKTTTYLSMDDD